jgi:glycosyltransferase involved in cell wall biosynthesis
MTVHDLTVVLYPELCDPPTLRFPSLIRRAVAEGAWIHTPSQFVADQVVAEFSVDPARVRSVHHGIPPAPAPPPLPCELPITLPEGCRRYVLAIGTIEPRKDYPLLVSAFGAVAAAHGDVALVVVGGDGWGAERFAAAVEASPARARIVRPGYLDDRSLDTVLRRASVLAYPSRYEGFGFPPLQAMAAGVPVVATAAGAIPEVVGDGAQLVEPGDGDGLAAALVWALDGGAAIDDLVERGRRRSGRFSWTACAEGLAHLYRDTLGRTDGSGR